MEGVGSIHPEGSHMFRRRFRRRRFGGRRAVARKEPIWITTAYNVTQAPQVTLQQLFQLIGPEDYTPDYVSEPQRKDKCTLIRTVGRFVLNPVIPPLEGFEVQPFVLTAMKGALFVAGDKEVDDAFANDPGQFDIQSPSVFPTFCRSFSPTHIFWNEYFQIFANASTVNPDIEWFPPGITGHTTWDINVKRKMEGDDALFLLLDVVFLQSEPQTFGGAIDVESRNLIMDQ